MRIGNMTLAAVLGATVALGSIAAIADDKKDERATTRVEAPHTKVDVDDETVSVEAPYTSVKVRPRRVRVRAPYVNLDIRW